MQRDINPARASALVSDLYTSEQNVPAFCRARWEHVSVAMHYPFVSNYNCCEAMMRITAMAIVSALIGLHASSATAQSFEDRWSIIPKAHAEPSPKTDDQTKPNTETQLPASPQETNRSESRSARTFSGEASFYSYRKAKTASGSSFDRDLPTAAHRTLPFGTKVRVTNLSNKKSVVVVINDRGPHVRGRVIDLSLAAARSLGITNRGVANVSGEVL